MRKTRRSKSQSDSCGSGGSYAYFLTAIRWAQSSQDYTNHAGPLLRGASGHYTCGT
ncbi:hypothetical protein [Streptomyces sp. TLI_171]|uniref:hypothetical protein n=1 Tax=Streptomyces sp. TLI_171 TaxID=1938859 RepID=UPI0015D54126|nr:hypothetical protein [Streptomyces sp. TLI_171]